MKKSNLLLKRMWTVLAVLFCTVVSTQAAEITYQLKTHVDGRTITASTNVKSGDALEANMPQKLWRAYTTYKYYSDEALTEEITTVPEDGSTVYVDYEFNPPFALSEEGGVTVYYTLRGNYANGNPYYFYGSGTEVGAIVNDYGQLANPDQGKWAYYGDGYSLNFLNKATGTWLGYNGQKTYPMLLSDKLAEGWQLFLTDWTKDGIQHFMLLIPEADDEISVESKILGLSDMSGSTAIMQPGGHGNKAIDNKCHWDDQANLIHGHDKISWGAFYGTISEDAETIWHVEYWVYDGANTLIDQQFYDKIKEDTPVDYYYQIDDQEYEYAYYHDADFTLTWDPADANDLIPATGTTIVYVKKLKFIEQPWKTLVLPIAISDLKAYFGEDYQGIPSVDVLEFQEVVDGVLTETREEDFYRCRLIFKQVDAIEAYKPYLFKVNRADEAVIEKIYQAEGNEPCEVTTFDDPANAGISVSMEGTLEDNGYYMDASDNLHFYFGYNDRNNTYNFYRKSAQIPRNRCWFYVNDNRASGAKLSVSFEMEGITGISQAVVDASANGKVYNLNGQEVQNTALKGIYIVNGKKVVK